MGKKENDNQSWFARHKTELIIGGIAVIGLAIGGSCYFLSSGKADVALAGVRNQLSKLTAINNKNLVNAPLANTEASLPTKTVFTVSEFTSECDAGFLPKRPYSSYSEPFPVRLHLRNLPEGCCPSPEKIAEGVKMGIDLLENHCTIVDPYFKGLAASFA